MEREHITQEQADEYALGVIEAALEERLTLHLIDCDTCAAMVARSRRAAARLALGVPLRKPPPSLRRRVLMRTGIIRPGPVGRVLRFVPAAAAVGAIFVGIAAFTGMLSIRGEVDDLRASNADLKTQIDDALSQKVQIAALGVRLTEEEQSSYDLRRDATGNRDLLLALLSPQSEVFEVFSVDPTKQSIGRLVWDRDQKKVWFVASKLPRRPDGETYQVWVDAGGKYESLGTFNSDGAGFARYETVVPEGLTSYTSAVVTIERAGGAPERSGPSVFVTDLSALRR